MKKYFCLMQKSFSSQTVYRSAAVFRFFASAVGFTIQICLWWALLNSGVDQGTTFYEMVCFVMINTLVSAITQADIASDLEPEIRDGSVVMHFLRPISFHFYLFFTMMGKNSYRVLTGVLPVLVLGSCFVGLPLPKSSLYFLFFLLSLIIGVFIIFELNYIVGLLAFWVQRTWYLTWYLEAGLIFFGGTVIPIWFYPSFMKIASYAMPFRYISFEAVNFYLGRTPIEQAAIPILLGLFWTAVLVVIGQLIWQRVQKKMTVNGG